MARTDDTDFASPSDRAIWRRAQQTEAERGEAEHLLDLAGFADSRLDDDETDRVAALLAADAEAAADIAAARAIAADPHVPESVIARASALAGGRGTVIAFRLFGRPRDGAYRLVGWGGIAAAIALASWFGFALGSDASLHYGRIAQSADDGYIGDMLDPSSNAMRGVTDGLDS